MFLYTHFFFQERQCQSALSLIAHGHRALATVSDLQHNVNGCKASPCWTRPDWPPRRSISITWLVPVFSVTESNAMTTLPDPPLPSGPLGTSRQAPLSRKKLPVKFCSSICCTWVNGVTGSVLSVFSEGLSVSLDGQVTTETRAASPSRSRATRVSSAAIEADVLGTRPEARNSGPLDSRSDVPSPACLRLQPTRGQLHRRRKNKNERRNRS